MQNPTRTGYIFTGWYDAASGGNKIGDAGSTYTPTTNTTLYAHWEPWTLKTNINLIDAETKNTIHENANFKVYAYNKGTGKYDTLVMNMTQKEDKTYITNNYLTYSDTNLGKFRIIEETAPYGYYGDWKDATETEKKYYDINIEEIIRTQNYSGQTVTDKGTINFTIENDRIKGKINANIIDTETKAGAQADATLEGAIYGIYAKENIVHADGVTGILYNAGDLVQRATFVNGTLTYDNLELGNYYIQQITPPNGYTKSNTKYEIVLPYEGEKVALVERNITVEEKVNKQAFQLIKVGNVGDNDELETLEGAGFKIYLISNLTKVKNGQIVAEENGNYNLEDFKDYDFSSENTAIDYTNSTQGQNIEEIFTNEDGYLLSPELAYGKYIVIESTVPAERVEIKPFFITIEEDNRTPKKLRVFYDAEFTAKIQVIKKDSKTNKTVLKANAQYRILNKETNEYVEQWVTYPSKKLLGTEENPYTTDETGTMTTPLTLNVGEYELQEVTAPEGYVLVGYEGKTEQGNYTATPKNNISFTISKTMVMEFDEDTKEAIMKVEQYNEQQLGSLTIDVSGEYLSGYTKDENGNYNFEYEERVIPGTEFTLYAKYNIYSQDNQNDIIFNKDEVVKTVVSDAEGKCIIDNLPLGIYYIKQTKAVDGFVLNKVVKDVEIAYEGQEKSVVYRNVSYIDQRQKVEITLINKDGETGESLSGGKFGLYTKKEITYTDTNGIQQKVQKEELIYEAETDKNGIARWNTQENVDLPLGEYYIKQIEVPEGYITSKNTIDINAKYRGQEKEKIEINVEFTNQQSKTIIRKQDEETKNGLSNVEMKLLNSKREELYSWTTDDTGEKEIRKLQPGETYILQEIKAKDNYVNDMLIDVNKNEVTKVANSEVTFVIKNITDVQNIVIGNKAKVGNINIIKKGEVLIGTEQNEEGNIDFKYEIQNLANAEYEIYAKEDIIHPDGKTGIIIAAGTKVAIGKTTEEGIIITNVLEEIKETYSAEVQKLLERGLPLGKYEIKETKAPEGYYRDAENSTQEVELKETEENEEVVTQTNTFVNERQKIDSNETDGETEKTGIYKYDEETKETIQGAVIGIYTSEDIIEKGNVIVEKDTLIQKGTTDEKGRIKVNKLPLGKYYVQEIEAAKGYEYKEDKIEVDFSSINEEQKDTKIYVEINNRKTEVNILKTDMDGNGIKGAKLELQDTDGNLIETWDTTEEMHNIRALETEKTYKIKETNPAKGYVTEKEKYFSLDKYGNIITEKENLYNENTIIMKDEKTKIQITVVDEKTEEKIEGIHVQILDKETQEVVYEFDTKEKEEVIEGLPIGEYDIIQSTTLDGYVTTHSELTIKDEKGVQENVLKQKISKLIIKVKDTEENKDIEASKIEIKDKETGKVIASTEPEENENILKIEKVEGGYLVERLPIQKYELEVKALEGYKEIDKKDITIEDVEEVQEVEVETRKLILDMKVEKYLNKISVNNEKQNINNNGINKIEIHKKAINKASIELEYIIKVSNIGEMAGTIGKIVDEMPENMQFEKDKSDSSWRQEGNILVSTEYANKELGVGESKEYKVVIKWINGKDNFGTKMNTAKIEGITNKLNYSDNNQNDNIAKVITLFSVATGSKAKIVIEIMNIILLAIIIIGILSMIEIKILRNK